ncbi:MAG: hypothetical protein VKJ66_05260 [Synechococcus sp.]|nr:hypothetical protein [Synechococcus sp.]
MANRAAAVVIIQCQVEPGSLESFMGASAQLAERLVEHPGCMEWTNHFDASARATTMQWQFASLDQATAWAHGPDVEAFLEAVTGMSRSPLVMNVLADIPEDRKDAATLVVTTRVNPGQDEWFADWQGRIDAAKQRWPGFLGQRVQAPVPGVNPDWVTMIAFDTEEHLRQWLDSAERHRLVAESEPHVQTYSVRPANSAFESWFPRSGSDVKPPPAWKLSAIVLLVLYPFVMLMVFTVDHVTQRKWNLDPAVGIFIDNVLGVSATGFLLIPWASNLLGWWLVPTQAKARRRTWQGGLLLLACYGASIAFFATLIAAFPGLMP